MNVQLPLPWLDEPAKRLISLHWQARLPHAILISGAKGLGKSALAKRLEKFYLCQNPQRENACGACQSCHLYQAQNHPDFLDVSASEKSANIDDIREINALLSKTPHQSGRFVIRMDEIHQLQVGAANALLKILEEPQENTLFLLTSSQKTVLPTIKSRCFTVNIPIPAHSQIMSWLKEKYPDSNHEQLQWCLTLAGGAPMTCIDLLSSQGLEKYHGMLFQILFKEEFSYIYDEELQRFFTTHSLKALYFIYYWLTEFVRFALKGSTDFPSNSFADVKLNSDKVVASKKVFIFLDKVNEAIQIITQPGINKLLIFESLFYQWQKMNWRGK